MDCTAGFPHKGQRTTSGKPAPIRRLGMIIKEIGDLWFRADDRAAAGHGWQIITRHGGLGRRYRDPRFGTLRACSQCNGSGDTDEPCGRCLGTGRVTTVAAVPGRLAR